LPLILYELLKAYKSVKFKEVYRLHTALLPINVAVSHVTTYWCVEIVCSK